MSDENVEKMKQISWETSSTSFATAHENNNTWSYENCSMLLQGFATFFGFWNVEIELKIFFEAVKFFLRNSESILNAKFSTFMDPFYTQVEKHCYN